MNSINNLTNTNQNQVGKEEQSSYRQIMKATSIFGGVQLFQIIIQILRSKAVAVLLGPAGMGINSLLNSTLKLMGGLTNFGLQTSAVKNVAEANAGKNYGRVAVVITVLRRWVWITGLFGSVLTITLSPWLSELTFGNRDYTTAFIWISVSLLFNQISTGQMVLLQGLRKLKYLANANLTGAVLGLIIALPLYYFYGVDGIVPAIITGSVANMLRSWYFARKVNIENVTVSQKTTLKEGKEMLIMGFMLSLSGLITMGVSYILRIYISNTGGVDQVGLYGAGFAIVNTYVGMIFTAMGTDYYPRLAGVASDNQKARKLINQQAEIAILILAPILTVFLVYINWVIIILYSQKFTGISEMIQWAAIGIFFKAASWSIAFIFLAKGAAQLYFWNELITNIYLLGFNILGYKYAGLDGLGISFLAAYLVYFIQVFIITRIKFQFSFDKEFIKIIGLQLTLGLVCFLTVKLISSPASYFIGSLIIIASSLYSLYELNKKMNLKGLIKRLKS